MASDSCEVNSRLVSRSLAGALFTLILTIGKLLARYATIVSTSDAGISVDSCSISVTLDCHHCLLPCLPITASGEWHMLQTIWKVSLPGPSGRVWAHAPHAIKHRRYRESFTPTAYRSTLQRCRLAARRGRCACR